MNGCTEVGFRMLGTNGTGTDKMGGVRIIRSKIGCKMIPKKLLIWLDSDKRLIQI